MPTWIALRCPSCTANLRVDGNTNQFKCEHCGTAYLLEHKASELKPAELEALTPLTTYTHQLKHWFKAGQHEILVHEVVEEMVQNTRLLYANVEYRNTTSDTLSARRNQWVLFDAEGYTYDTASNSAYLEDRSRPPLSGERFVNPGMRVRGWVVFKVPPTATVERLQFLTGYLSTKTIEFWLKPQTASG